LVGAHIKEMNMNLLDYLNLLDDVLLSPHFTAILSFLVLYRWVLKLIYDFKWTTLGGTIPRFLFCVIYLMVMVYNPNAEDIRLYIRFAINLLFLDELANWWVSTSRFKEWINKKWILPR
jgi:hypothetical protein